MVLENQEGSYRQNLLGSAFVESVELLVFISMLFLDDSYLDSLEEIHRGITMSFFSRFSRLIRDY